MVVFAAAADLSGKPADFLSKRPGNLFSTVADGRAVVATAATLRTPSS
jgi:hypothetical protein